MHAPEMILNFFLIFRIFISKDFNPNLDSSSPDTWGEFPVLCNSAIVDATCEVLNQKRTLTSVLDSSCC